MQILSLVWGILAIIGMLVFFLPCLGAFNWLHIPFSAVGLIISIVALATAKTPNRTGAVVGIVCCSIAIVLGLIRLAVGGGVL